MIRHVIDEHDKAIPAVLEIPSKDHPYDPNKDSILRRAKVQYILYYNSNVIDVQGMFNADDFRS